MFFLSNLKTELFIELTTFKTRLLCFTNQKIRKIKNPIVVFFT